MLINIYFWHFIIKPFIVVIDSRRSPLHIYIILHHWWRQLQEICQKVWGLSLMSRIPFIDNFLYKHSYNIPQYHHILHYNIELIQDLQCYLQHKKLRKRMTSELPKKRQITRCSIILGILSIWRRIIINLMHYREIYLSPQ